MFVSTSFIKTQRIPLVCLPLLLAACGEKPTAAMVSVTVSPANITIAAGESQQFTATATYDDATTKNVSADVTWSVTAVSGSATIDAAGLATATGAGEVTVSAVSGTISGHAALTITPAGVSLVSVAVTPAVVNVAIGADRQFTAIGAYSDSSVKDITSGVTWSTTSVTGSATISETGLATATALGEVTVTAANGAISGAATLTVTEVGVDPDLNPTLITERPYDHYVPTSYDGSAPMPLVLALHGLGDTGPNYESAMGFSAIAEANGFLFAYPSGTAVFGGGAGWNATINGVLPLLEADDVTYLRAVIADMAEQYNVDPKRIYVQGLSNGGFMAHVLACVAADKIAAIAPISGTQWVDDLPDCQPSEPVAVMHTHGTADATIDYNGGTFSMVISSADYVSAPESVANWVTLNGCGATPVTATFDADTGIAGAETDIEVYSGCTNNVSVELWTINDGEHVPGISQAYIDSVVDFLYSHPKP